MPFTEELVSACAMAVKGSLKVDYQGTTIDLTPPWRQIDFRTSLLEIGGVPPRVLFDTEMALDLSRQLGGVHKPQDGLGKALDKIFEVMVEKELVQPTFITGYPRDISPLSRPSDHDPDVVDRFEFFIAGREMGNGFSELNDPDDQFGPLPGAGGPARGRRRRGPVHGRRLRAGPAVRHAAHRGRGTGNRPACNAFDRSAVHT